MSKTERLSKQDREPRSQVESNASLIECVDCGELIKWMEAEDGVCDECSNLREKEERQFKQ